MLVKAPTLKDSLAELREHLPEGFPISNDDPFSVFGTFLELAAQGQTDIRAFVRDLYPQGFDVSATGEWLDLHARDHALARIPARPTRGEVRFYCASAGTVPPGTVVQTPVGADGSIYRFFVPERTECKPPFTRVPVVAEAAGGAWNVGPGRITTLVTILDFVERIENDSAWITQAGVDEESDALLRDRILLRWPALGTGVTYHAYELWARDVQGVVKVSVLDDHPRGQGTVDVLVAPTQGLPEADLVASANDVIQARRPITADVDVRAPRKREQPLDVTVYLSSPDYEGAAAWESRVRAVAESLDIAEPLYPSEIGAALHRYDAVEGVDVLVPGDIVVPARDQLIVPSSVNVSLIVR